MRAHALRRHCSLLALALCGCTVPLITADTPKSVRGQPIAPYEWHEECLHLEAGDRVDYSFESSEPVSFNIHYHEGNAVVMPIVRDKTLSDAGVFVSPERQDYCLMWEAGAAGALLDFQVRVRILGG